MLRGASEEEGDGRFAYASEGEHRISVTDVESGEEREVGISVRGL